MYVSRPIPTKPPEAGGETDPHDDIPRLRRSLDMLLSANGTLLGNVTDFENSSTSAEEDALPVAYSAVVVYHKTWLLLTNLEHFQEYSIEV